MKILILIPFLFFSHLSIAKKPKAKAPRSKGSLQFDGRTVKGQIYRPELSVVTGDNMLQGFGMLRLRKNFQENTQAEARGQKAIYSSKKKSKTGVKK